MSSPSIVATTTWNSRDVIPTFISHYQRLGFERLLVMDFQSTDGTVDVLTDPVWRGFIEVVPFPGLRGLDSSNVLLSVAKERCGPEVWCLFCDPDELLVASGMDMRQASPDALSHGAGVLLLPRFNVTAPRSVAGSNDDRLTALDALTLRIDRRHQRVVERDMHADTLVPPWIFTAILGKVFVRLDRVVAIGAGDHTAQMTSDIACAETPDMFLLHYPFRSYSTFHDKIELARTDFAANPHRSQMHGWQVRRWINLADANLLYREYLEQFIVDEDIEPMIRSRSIAIERRVEQFHQIKHQVRRRI